MEAVYVLTGVEKKVPEVFASRYDIRYILDAASVLNDYEKPKINFAEKSILSKKIRGTEIEELLKEYNLI
ncbi:hypothetical protein [Anaerococcus murdochii]|uniref:hypothetical protein n=1 Tax=Anaerococcus murdochii TaxID=411577 RepID=UPI003D6D17E8